MEGKRELKIEEKKSLLGLENRKKLNLTGIVEVYNFDESKILLNTNQGVLTIKGQNLKMNKLDVQNGEVIIMGTVDSIVYSSAEVKKDKENIFAKLFK